MISSKFCIDFFFKYNSKLLVTPIPEINFEEFSLLILKLSLPVRPTPPSIPNKYQEFLSTGLVHFQLFFEDMLKGPNILSNTLEGLISKFQAFLEVELKAISLYNEAKLFLFKEIDYMTLTYRRLLNFLQDLDQYIVKALKRQALIELFHKAFSQIFSDVLAYQEILQRVGGNPQTFAIFLRIKDFLSEKLIDINEVWSCDNTHRKLINEENSENLSLELNETPNKFDKSHNFQASKIEKTPGFFEINDHSKSMMNSLGPESQIEIELKNMHFEEPYAKASRHPFDETFLPLKEPNGLDSSLDNSLLKAGVEKNFIKLQTKTLSPKKVKEESLLLRPNASFTIGNRLNKEEYTDPKSSFRKFYMENSKYQIKTKEKTPSVKKPVSHIQVNGVVFIDPLYLLDQDGRKEDFSLFNDLIDEDVDENNNDLDQSIFGEGKTTSVDSKVFFEEENRKSELTPVRSSRSKNKKISSKIHQRPPLSSGKKSQPPFEVTPKQKSIPDFNISSIGNACNSQCTINLGLLNDSHQKEDSSSEEQEEGLAISPLIRRNNFLKKTFVEGGFSTHPTVRETEQEGAPSNIDVLLTEPEILKAISLSCGVSSNHSSVFLAKWLVAKEKRKRIKQTRFKAKKRWAVLRRVFEGYQFGRQAGLVKSFAEFILKKGFKSELVWLGKVMFWEGLPLMGKGTKQGQGEGGLECEGEFIYAVNRKVRDFRALRCWGTQKDEGFLS